MPKETRAGLHWICTRSTDSVYALLREMARTEQRSVSNLMMVLVLEAMEARGVQLPEDAVPPQDGRSYPPQKTRR